MHIFLKIFKKAFFRTKVAQNNVFEWKFKINVKFSSKLEKSSYLILKNTQDISIWACNVQF